MNLNPDRFAQNGFYLVLPTDQLLFFSKDVIAANARRFLTDPSKIPPQLRKAIEAQPCAVCPMKGAGEFCHALLPTLPVVDAVDQHKSFEPAAAIYRSGTGRTESVAISKTTLQDALRYVSVLSLVHYCEAGQKYREWFAGVTPVTAFDELVNRVYLNVFWLCRGNRRKVRELLNRFADEIGTTVRCQSDRLKRICKHDGFVNAFSTTHLITYMLSRNADETVRNSLDLAREEWSAIEPPAAPPAACGTSCARTCRPRRRTLPSVLPLTAGPG